MKLNLPVDFAQKSRTPLRQLSTAQPINLTNPTSGGMLLGHCCRAQIQGNSTSPQPMRGWVRGGTTPACVGQEPGDSDDSIEADIRVEGRLTFRRAAKVWRQSTGRVAPIAWLGRRTELLRK